MAYLITNNCQVDSAVSRSLNRRTPDLSLTVGLSFKLQAHMKFTIRKRSLLANLATLVFVAIAGVIGLRAVHTLGVTMDAISTNGGHEGPAAGRHGA